MFRFFNFFTDFGVPIIDSICFSITKGDSDVTCVSLFVDSIIINFGKFSCALNSVEASISSSESGRLCAIESIFFSFKSRRLCASPSLEPYKGTLYGNGSPVSNAKATYPSYSPCKIPKYFRLPKL